MQSSQKLDENVKAVASLRSGWLASVLLGRGDKDDHLMAGPGQKVKVKVIKVKGTVASAENS